MAKQRSVFRNQRNNPSFFKKWLKRLLSTVLSLIVLVVGAAYWLLNGSMPQYEGSLEVANISADISIKRDELGTVKISANNRLDASFALGFTHAQERYFQMDLLRRRSAGELSELFGSVALDADKAVRMHQFRSRAQQILNTLTDQEKQLVEVYTDGVNYGLSQLQQPPFEYLLLRSSPKLWQQEDTLLVVYSMYLSLQRSSVEQEAVLQTAEATLPTSLFEFLVPEGTSFDAPIDFSKVPLPELPELNMENYRAKLANNTASLPIIEDDKILGSNNFAVTAERSHYGTAIVAGDMHLGHGVPNIWYKVNMSIANNDSQLMGVTLPGTPLVVAGTNAKIAWVFTNSYGDYADAVVSEINPDNEHQYRDGDQWLEFQYDKEIIKVNNQADHEIVVKKTIYGPVEKVSNGQATSLLWVAHDSKAININSLNLETATNIEQAFDIAHNSAIPAQNFVVGDADGQIGWSIIGPMPKRIETTSRYRTIATTNGKIQWLDAADYPIVKSNGENAIWTANGRIVGNENLKTVGRTWYAMGVRGKIIRDELLKLSKAEETDLLKIALNTKGEVYQRWQQHLIEQLKLIKEPDEQQQELLRLVKQWNGNADTDQVGFTFIRAYRSELRKRIIDPWVKVLSADAQRNFSYYSSQYEYPLWQIITNQALAFLPKDAANYSELYQQAINSVIDKFTENNQVLADQTWGSNNRLNIQHPISRGLAILQPLLNPPRYEMPGESNSPRVQGASFGASQRMVIAPGHLDKAIFHMPGGQSGHPLSEYFQQGFDDWVYGRATPLMIGSTKYQLILKPSRAE
ncbi:MAG: penicillin acylase family protein [Kangiellaceae bacterium]|jgi:penicillin amidase|nr:penicillin acylase family protein [Kangiellaceae bacterium]